MLAPLSLPDVVVCAADNALVLTPCVLAVVSVRGLRGSGLSDERSSLLQQLCQVPRHQLVQPPASNPSVPACGLHSGPMLLQCKLSCTAFDPTAGCHFSLVFYMLHSVCLTHHTSKLPALLHISNSIIFKFFRCYLLLCHIVSVPVMFVSRCTRCPLIQSCCRSVRTVSLTMATHSTRLCCYYKQLAKYSLSSSASRRSSRSKQNRRKERSWPGIRNCIL